MRYVKLENSTELVLVDDNDFKWVDNFKWRLTPEGYIQRTMDGKLIHRLIMNIEYTKIQIDHIDLNKFNNQKDNLRPVSNAQNTQNQGARKNSSSKYRGVCWHKRSNKWMADVMLDGKHNYLGLFNNEKDAAQAASDFRRANMPYSMEKEII